MAILSQLDGKTLSLTFSVGCKCVAYSPLLLYCSVKDLWKEAKNAKEGTVRNYIYKMWFKTTAFGQFFVFSSFLLICSIVLDMSNCNKAFQTFHGT